MRRFFLTAMLAALPVLAFADAQEARLLRFPSVGGIRLRSPMPVIFTLSL